MARKTASKELKARVALEAHRGEQTGAQISSESWSLGYPDQRLEEAGAGGAARAVRVGP